MRVEIDIRQVEAYARQLARMNRSALPVAVRSALNSAAFDVKKDTMPRSAKDKFVERKPNFFKANSKVVQAQGFDVRSMQSEVGFTPRSGTDKSVDDLEHQEHGTDIGGRTFIPLKQARTGGSWNKNVRLANRITEIGDKIVDSHDVRGRNEKQKFVKSAVHAGKGGWVIGNNHQGQGRILFSIRSLKRKDGNMLVKSVAMFSVKKNRKVRPRASHFMETASRQSHGKMERFFIAAARKQIQRAQNR